jgi:UDP:flavonoid glycosyltransferase YjiC (YdhE family)
VKVLFVVPPLAGHTNPALAVAAALERRGHETLWFGRDPEALPPEVAGAVATRSRGLRGLESVQFLWRDFIVPLARAWRPPIERLLTERSPDVVVVDHQAVGGALAARRAGIPWATLATTSAPLVAPFAAFPRVAAWVDGELAALAREAGLPGEAGVDLSPSCVIVTSTRALVGDAPLPPQARLVGPALGGRPADASFPWERLAPGRRVLVSLGTISAERGAAFYRAVAGAFEGLQAILVAPPEIAGEMPPHVLVLPRVPQLELLERVDAVVTHGGHNTVCEALFHGLPLVVAPIRDDQPVIAGQVVAAGCGVRVRFGGLSAATLAAAVRRVLDEPSFREAAGFVKESFRGAGGAEEAARLVESLAA